MKFRRQLHSLLQENNQLLLFDRIKKGSEYYKNFLQNQVTQLLTHIEETRQRKRVKAYLASLTDLDLLFSKTLEEIDKFLYITETIFEVREQFDFSELTAQRHSERDRIIDVIRNSIKVKPHSKKRRKKDRSSKGNEEQDKSTYDITLEFFLSGMRIEDIAKERGLTTGTIENHLAKAIAARRVDIYSFMTNDEVDLIINALNEMPQDFTSKDLFEKLDAKFSYGKLRAVINHKALDFPPSP